MIKQDKQFGFTLVELIIAIAVFTVGIMGAFTLALANLRIARENQDRVIAADLAREGLELMRNIRDTNLLRLQDNEDCHPNPGLQLCTYSTNIRRGLYAVDIYDNYPDVPPSLMGFCDNPGDNWFGCTCLNNGCDLNIDSNNYYSHDPGTVTNFVRRIATRPLCFDGTTENFNFDPSGCVGANNIEIGLEVSVRVDWNRYGQSDNVMVKELLYNWRR